MGEKNKFIIIDEKPKRELIDEKPPSRLRLRIIIIGVLSLTISLAYLGFVTCFGASDCNGYRFDLDFTATSIVQTNLWVARMMTLTDLAQEGYIVTASPNSVASATAISMEQTRLAATQNALLTAQARIIPTLTALATPVP